MLWPRPSVHLGQLAPTTLPQCRLVSNPRSAGLSLSLSLSLAFRSVGFSLSLSVSPTLSLSVCLAPPLSQCLALFTLPRGFLCLLTLPSLSPAGGRGGWGRPSIAVPCPPPPGAGSATCAAPLGLRTRTHPHFAPGAVFASVFQMLLKRSHSRHRCWPCVGPLVGLATVSLWRVLDARSKVHCPLYARGGGVCVRGVL